MRVISLDQIENTDRQVDCPQSGFSSFRFLLEKDELGFSLHRTLVPKGEKQFWHYKHHVEACYCVSGKGELTDQETGESWLIQPDMVYAPDKHDPHWFRALGEVHDEEGSYEPQAKSPVYQVRSVPIEKVKANDYNPNAVAPPEMELLETSIWEDGYTQPVVTYYDSKSDTFIVVDGFHRYLILKNSKRIREREKGRLPVVVIDKELSDRMASTIRHNRARGTHNIELMSTIVAELVEMGKGDRWICKHIGMSADELLRLKQITGVAALFANRDFSDSWEVDEDL
jgi:mannose-6-phosphate isomerase-like protein (cupin superfamily)